MIDRYSRPEMARVWSRDAKYEAWLRVELAVCEVYSRRGLIPADALGRIKAGARISADRIEEIEKTTRHDVIAFLTNLEDVARRRLSLRAHRLDVLGHRGHRARAPAPAGVGAPARRARAVPRGG